MNWHHLQTILWLKWRLSVNRWKRGGLLNFVFGIIIMVIALFVAAMSLLLGALLGVFLGRQLTADQWMLVWDVTVVAFLIFWILGLITELQQGEALSFDKLLHLPISMWGAFLLNYLASLISLSLLMFIPLTTGMALALVYLHGFKMLLVLVLTATFFLMTTAITHQFRSWLHLLMLNKRRRRTIVAIATLSLILVVQLPNLLNLTVLRNRRGDSGKYDTALEQLDAAHVAGKLDSQQYQARQKQIREQRRQERARHRARNYRAVVHWGTWANRLLPIGWLPYGAGQAVAGRLWPGMFGAGGALALAVLSLRRSHRTALNRYRGTYSARPAKAAAKAGAAATDSATRDPGRLLLLERRLPGIPDGAAAVALASFKCLLRGPEGKMALATPVILVIIFGSMLLTGRSQAISEAVVPLIALGTISLALLSFVQWIGNTFGSDRLGFKNYVLCPCDRRDILLGKNLSIAPMVVGIPIVLTLILPFLWRMHISHILANLVQIICAFLLSCLLGNVASIATPFAVAPGTTKAAHASFLAIVVQIVMAMVMPLTILPAMLAYGTELLLVQIHAVAIVPWYLLFSLAEVAGVLWLYGRILPLQGRMLQRHETRVFEIVSKRHQ